MVGFKISMCDSTMDVKFCLKFEQVLKLGK